jgi:hypothetical protein
MVTVELTGGEIALAAFVAGMRLKNVIDKNLSETNGSKREGALQRHITGAQGEASSSNRRSRTSRISCSVGSMF